MTRVLNVLVELQLVQLLQACIKTVFLSLLEIWWLQLVVILLKKNEVRLNESVFLSQLCFYETHFKGALPESGQVGASVMSCLSLPVTRRRFAVKTFNVGLRRSWETELWKEMSRLKFLSWICLMCPLLAKGLLWRRYWHRQSHYHGHNCSGKLVFDLFHPQILLHLL